MRDGGVIAADAACHSPIANQARFPNECRLKTAADELPSNFSLIELMTPQF
jgi:hypothetical protein